MIEFSCLIRFKFRFVDRLDFILIFIAAIMIMIYIFCLLFDLILSGQLAGLFATKSFNDSCEYENPNLIHTINTTTTICPLGICDHNKEIVSLATTTFRKDVMHVVQLLFGELIET